MIQHLHRFLSNYRFETHDAEDGEPQDYRPNR
jgi:hypothetical protein